MKKQNETQRSSPESITPQREVSLPREIETCWSKKVLTKTLSKSTLNNYPEILPETLPETPTITLKTFQTPFLSLRKPSLCSYCQIPNCLCSQNLDRKKPLRRQCPQSDLQLLFLNFIQPHVILNKKYGAKQVSLDEFTEFVNETISKN